MTAGRIYLLKASVLHLPCSLITASGHPCYAAHVAPPILNECIFRFLKWHILLVSRKYLFTSPTDTGLPYRSKNNCVCVVLGRSFEYSMNDFTAQGDPLAAFSIFIVTGPLDVLLEGIVINSSPLITLQPENNIACQAFELMYSLTQRKLWNTKVNIHVTRDPS